METGRIVIAALSFSVAGLGAFGQPVLVRPGPCAAPQTYLLAANSAAIIRVESEEQGVIVYREQRRGWASRRLLQRFDLSLDAAGPAITNSGKFCRGTQ